MRVVLVFALLTSCVDLTASDPLPDADYESFVSEVQPLLAEQCSNPSCHGTSDRPLALFAVHMNRLDPNATYLDSPLTEEELDLNYVGLLGFLEGIDRAKQSALLHEPLAPQAGGSQHVGGTQFTDTSAYGYRVLERWIETTLPTSSNRSLP